MSVDQWGRWALASVCALVMAAAASPAAAQQQGVTTRVVSHKAVAGPDADNPLAAWKAQYAEALDASQQLQRSPATRTLGEQLELELTQLDEALRAYVRAGERLRHKNRAVAATLDELPSSDAMSSRNAQTISNALSAAHDAEMATIGNLK